MNVNERPQSKFSVPQKKSMTRLGLGKPPSTNVSTDSVARFCEFPITQTFWDLYNIKKMSNGEMQRTNLYLVLEKTAEYRSNVLRRLH